MTDSMRTLVLMRHSKSSWTQDVPDHRRPLSSRGRRDGRAAGRLLAQRQLSPDLVLCSTAERARQTFDRTVSGGASFGDIVYADDLYEATPDQLAERIRATSEDVGTLLVVGHGPAIGEVVADLARREKECPLWATLEERFPTSAMAVIEFDGAWDAIDPRAGRLVAFEVPRG